MRETREIEIRVIADDETFIDLTLPVEVFEKHHEKQFYLATFPTLEEVNKIRHEICKDAICECTGHRFYRMRDIYKDGKWRLEIFVERIDPSN